MDQDLFAFSHIVYPASRFDWIEESLNEREDETDFPPRIKFEVEEGLVERQRCRWRFPGIFTLKGRKRKERVRRRVKGVPGTPNTPLWKSFDRPAARQRLVYNAIVMTSS